MVKLSGGEEVHPFPRVVGAEGMKICFNLLIGPFSLSICLRVICGGELDSVVKESRLALSQKQIQIVDLCWISGNHEV